MRRKPSALDMLHCAANWLDRAKAAKRKSHELAPVIREALR